VKALYGQLCPSMTPPTSSFSALAPVARASVVDTIAQRIQNEILHGRLEAGSRLPSERDLAVSLGVNRLTLRSALARLEALGFIATRHGAGTVVSAWRERAGLDVLPAMLLSLEPAAPAWRELMVALLEVRRILVSEAIALAAMRRSPDDLAVLRALAREQAQNLGDAVGFARGEVAFQRAVIRAAGNVGLELILNTFAKFPEELPELVAKLYDQREASMEFYEIVIAMIEGGDGTGARDAVRHVLQGVDDAWCVRHAVTGKSRARTIPRKPSAKTPGASPPRAKQKSRK
jgi:GntR family transcriptional regulator, transcriptional repressor for pyruvate dehydrogenase complex